MNRPDPKDLNEILNHCITKLQNGQGMESILGEYPDYAAYLRPILEALLVVWSSRGSDTVPMAAMQRSRRRLLSAAAGVKQARALPWWRRPFGMMRGVMVPVMIMLVCAGLLFTGIASAEALPGQPLYPVKLAAEQIGLSLPASPSGRLAKEENYDLRRKDEVEVLITKQREQEVNLTGFLKRGDNASWQIDDLKVTISAVILPEAERLTGRYVAVHGKLLESGEVVAQSIEARVYIISGKIIRIEGSRIQIGDIWVEITPETKVSGTLGLGRDVRVNIVRIAGDGYLAVNLYLPQDASAEDATRPGPSETPEPRFDSTATEVEVERSATPDDPQPQATREPEHKSEPTESEKHDDDPKPAATSTVKPGDSEEEHSDPTTTARPRRRWTRTPTPTEQRDGEHDSTKSPTKEHDD